MDEERWPLVERLTWQASPWVVLGILLLTALQAVLPLLELVLAKRCWIAPRSTSDFMHN